MTISALVVLGMYGYRRLTETSAPPVTAKKLVGIGKPVPLGAFATAWGFTFLIVAIMAEAAPGLGGAFAILIATGDFLTNTSNVLADVTKLEKPSASSAGAGAGKAGAGLSSIGTGLQSAAGTQIIGGVH